MKKQQQRNQHASDLLPAKTLETFFRRSDGMLKHQKVVDH